MEFLGECLHGRSFPCVQKMFLSSMSPASHSESVTIMQSLPIVLTVHILFTAHTSADPSAVVALSHPPLSTLFFNTGPSLSIYLCRSQPMRGGRMLRKAPMRPLFHLYKTFQASLPGCTFCQSRAKRRGAEGEQA